jgi:predicted dehydrogenase
VPRRLTDLRAAVVGTGFVGVLHVEALRRIGVQVKGVVGSVLERAAAKAGAFGLPAPYPDLEAVLEDDVDAVHVATPNHLHHAQVKAILAAGKHVVCEKPLALTSAQSRELLELARASDLVHCTNFNLRFYPVCWEARGRIRSGQLGAIWGVHGSYLQDWLLLPTDWNWRLDPEQGGALRAVADIGSHWLDLTSFATGLEVEEVFAELGTVLPVRRRPAGPVETFAAGGEVEREDVAITTEDLAFVLVRYGGGGRGSVVVSQVSAGRKNALTFEVDGSVGSLAWCSERCEELWIGHRVRANEVLLRDPSLLGPEAASVAALPGGHTEGYADTFAALYRAFYADVAEGGPADEPAYPTFEAGHEEVVIGEAIARSTAEDRWIRVTRDWR